MNPLNTLKTITLALILAFGISYVFAWTGPSTTPPNGNVTAPINAGTTGQTKTSYFAATQLISSIDITSPKFCIGTDCITSWSSVGGGVPSGAIMSFYLSSCPGGWKIADGTNGTPDLRGYFVRGFGTNSDGTASDVLGVKVADEYRSHSHSGVTGGIETHTYSANDSKVQRGSADKTVLTSLSGAVNYPQSTLYINPSGGSETRPKNIALLYCQKI